jgi:ATP-dependent RNA helicase DDX41
MEEETPTRRRAQRSPSPVYDLDEDYEPYVPLSQRREQKLAKLLSHRLHHKPKVAKLQDERADSDREDSENEEERRKEIARKERTLLMEAQEVHSKQAAEDAKKTDVEKAEEADAEMLAAIAARRKLASDLELAKGIQYTETLKTSWQPPAFIRDRSPQDHQIIRDRHHIYVDGEDVPPPIEHFSACFQFLFSFFCG